MAKVNPKHKNNLFSKLSTQHSMISSHPSSAPMPLQGVDPFGLSNQRNWSEELIAAATTLQSIAMSGTRVRQIY